MNACHQNVGLMALNKTELYMYYMYIVLFITMFKLVAEGGGGGVKGFYCV